MPGFYLSEMFYSTQINLYNLRMNKFLKIIRLPFFIFLDISGILLGLFLTGLGFFTGLGWGIPLWLGWFIFILGIAAFLLHVGHYFDLKYMRWLFGDKYFIEK